MNQPSLQPIISERGITSHGAFVRVMGLTFSNRLGIAAGIDRTGLQLASLARLGTGHVEVGTVTDPRELKLPDAVDGSALVVGVNIASALPGFSGEVASDYMACLAAALPRAHYIVLNFSNEAASRSPRSEGAFDLVADAAGHVRRYCELSGRHVPVLVKLHAGSLGEAVPAARGLAAQIDGFVVVGGSADRLAELRQALPQHGIVSVGGVLTGRHMQDRTMAGADLVQIHRAFAEGGANEVERILRAQARP